MLSYRRCVLPAASDAPLLLQHTSCLVCQHDYASILWAPFHMRLTRSECVLSVLQGSLSDLRMEVATAQNLSTSAGAAVADSASQQQQQQRHNPSSLARATTAAGGAAARPSSAPRTASYPSASAGGGGSLLRPLSGMAGPTTRAAVPIRTTTREAFAEPSYLSGSSSMFSSPSAPRTMSSAQPRSMLDGVTLLHFRSLSLLISQSYCGSFSFTCSLSSLFFVCNTHCEPPPCVHSRGEHRTQRERGLARARYQDVGL